MSFARVTRSTRSSVMALSFLSLLGSGCPAEDSRTDGGAAGNRAETGGSAGASHSGGTVGTGGSGGAAGSRGTGGAPTGDGGTKGDASVDIDGGGAHDAGACRRTGCSGQICSAEDVASTCEYRNEYGCYKSAACERQADGKCGFTPSETLTTCLANGGPGDAGPSDGGAAACDFASSYEYGFIGGLVRYTDRSYLSPSNMYRHVRTPAADSGTPTSCSPAMPACGADDVISAADVERDLAHADVRAALAEAQTPLFGYDNRPADGVVFEFKAASGKSLLVGEPCESRAGCRMIPVGVQRLRDRLQNLDQQQLAAQSCKTAGLTP